MSTTPAPRLRLSLRELASYAISKGVPGLIMFGAVPLWTNLYGPAEYGFYSIAWSLCGVFSALLSGWIRQATLRYAGNAALSPTRLPRKLVPLLVVGSWLLALAILPLTTRSPDLAHIIWLCIASCAFLTASIINSIRVSYAQRERHAGRFALAESLRLLVAIVVSLAALAVPPLPGSAAILFGYAAGSSVSLLVLPRKPREELREPSVAVAFWRFGWPMTIWLALSSVLVYVDRIVISATLGAERAGAYAATADLIVRGFAMATFPVTMTLHPVVMRAWNSGQKYQALAAVRRHSLVLAGWVAFGTTLVVAVGPPIVAAVANVPRPSRVLLLLLSVGGALWQLALITHKPLEMADRSRLMAVLMLASVAITIVSSVGLVALFEEVGVAAGLTVGAFTYVALAWHFGNRTVRAHRLEEVTR